MKPKFKPKSKSKSDPNKIYPADWLMFKPYEVAKKTDQYYVHIANEVNELLEIMFEDMGYDQVVTKNQRKELAIVLTSYLEDYIENIGIWRAFTDHNVETIGRRLPFFDLTEYDPDYLNHEDLRYIMWSYFSKAAEERFFDPQGWGIEELGNNIFELLEDMIDDAPISEFYEDFFAYKEGDGFEILKDKLFWFSNFSYLMGPAMQREFMLEMEEHSKAAPDGLLPIDHYISLLGADYMFLRRSEYGALSAPEWVSRLVRGSEEMASAIKGLEPAHLASYRCVEYSLDLKHLLFVNIDTSRKYWVRVDSFESKSAARALLGELCITSFQSWMGEWWATGLQAVLDKDESELKGEEEDFRKSYLFPPEEYAILIEKTDALEKIFHRIFGGPVALFDNLATAEGAWKMIVDGYNKYSNAKSLRFRDFEGNLTLEEFERYPKTGVAAYFRPGAGVLFSESFRDMVSLGKDELGSKIMLFWSFCSEPPILVKWYVEQKGIHEFLIPVPDPQTNVVEWLDSYSRFFAPVEYEPVFPLVLE